MSLISIITPSYNSARFISETIHSVLSQSITNWEMIVVDDCSVDNSVEIIRSFIAVDSRIKLIQLTENSGAAVARNAAIKESKGRYIAFLDSDDLWSPNKLEMQLEFMQRNNYPFTFAAYDKIDEHGKVFGSIGVPDRVSYTELLKTCSIGCLTAMYDTKYLGKVTMPPIRKRQDFGLWLRLLKKTDFAYGLNITLAQYRVRPGSISANKFNAAMHTWHLYRDIERLKFFYCIYFFSHYAIRGLLRSKLPKLAKLLRVLN